MANNKLTRVNLSTQADAIIATMRAEIPVALYHFRKPYGGRRKYMIAEGKLLDKALAEEQSQMTDINEYISRTGNRWMTYTMVDYYPKAEYANATHVSFIYYETYGSCGAFFPLYEPESVKHKKKNEGQADGVMIFTSHFFLRMSERTGKAYRSRELIQEFISTKSTQACETAADGEVIVKFKGGYGFGVEKSKNPRVVEVRTYLTDGQLSPKQRKKVEMVDAYAEIIGEGMYLPEVALGTTLNTLNTLNTPQKIASEGERMLAALTKVGMEKPMMLMTSIHLGFVRLLQDILQMEISMQQSAVICQIEAECGMDSLINKYIDFDGSTATDEENNRFMFDTIDLYCKTAKKMRLKSVNRETITRRICEIMASSQKMGKDNASGIN